MYARIIRSGVNDPASNIEIFGKYYGANGRNMNNSPVQNKHYLYKTK